MRILAMVWFFMCCAHTHGKDSVILLHGLARRSASMRKMENALAREGYSVVNHSYASRKNRIQDLAAAELPIALNKCLRSGRIHFVTHSLGGILLRQYLRTNGIERLGRTVMLGPPNQGSQVVDTLRDFPGYQWINGPAGMQLGTDPESVPLLLGRAEFELGIIAGTKSINLILSTMLPSPDDGKVSVENTKLEGMKDHIAIPVSHPFLMKDALAIQQTIYFLGNGRFQKNRTPHP
jgi:triacylglycerol lipase